MKTIAISLALGDIYTDKGLGRINKPFDGAVARFEAIARAVENKNALIICTAGYTRKQPLTPQKERVISLSGQLARYVSEYKPSLVKRLLCKPLCWSTRNEVRVGIKLAQRVGFANKTELANLFIVSNASHLIRVWLYTKFYTPPAWKVNFVKAEHHFSIISHLLEIPKILRDILYILRVLDRLESIKRLHTASW